MKNKENYFGCLTFIACVILGIGWVASSSNKNEEISKQDNIIAKRNQEIKDLKSKIESKERVIAYIADSLELKNENSLPLYVYLDKQNCIHILERCVCLTSHRFVPMEEIMKKVEYMEEANINIDIPTSNYYPVKRLKVSETDFSKYEWYCAECVEDFTYQLMQKVVKEREVIKNKKVKPSPTNTVEDNENASLEEVLRALNETIKRSKEDSEILPAYLR